MSQFACSSCGHQGHFIEFKTGSHFEPADDDEMEPEEVDDVECPSCGSASVFEE